MQLLTYPIARLLAAVAERHAAGLGVPMAIAVADATGAVLCFGRMEGNLPASSEIAMGKAYTAASLRMSTADLGRLAQPGGMLYGIEHTFGGRVVLFGGGLPLRLQDRVVGAIGISGGTVDQDIEVAEPAVEALSDMELWAERFSSLNIDLPVDPDPVWVGRLLDRTVRVLTEMNCASVFDASHILTGALLLTAQSSRRVVGK